MGKKLRGFRYPLESIQRLYDWDAKQLKHYMALLAQDAARRDAEMTSARNEISDAFQAAREANLSALDPAYRRMWLIHLSQLQKKVDQTEIEQVQAQAAADAALTNYLDKRSQLLGVEAMRDKAILAYSQAQAAQEGKLMDEAWLQAAFWKKKLNAYR